jgi:hypothetical protein
MRHSTIAFVCSISLSLDPGSKLEVDNVRDTPFMKAPKAILSLGAVRRGVHTVDKGIRIVTVLGVDTIPILQITKGLVNVVQTIYLFKAKTCSIELPSMTLTGH